MVFKARSSLSVALPARKLFTSHPARTNPASNFFRYGFVALFIERYGSGEVFCFLAMAALYRHDALLNTTGQLN